MLINYIIRRLLLMIPTFIGITIVYFTVLQLAPGGPVENQIAQMQKAMSGEGGKGGMASMGVKFDMANHGIPKEAIEQLRKFYGFDKPIPIRYLLWIGLWPREKIDKKLELNKITRVTLKNENDKNGKMFQLQQWVKLERDDLGNIKILQSGIGADFAFNNYPELPPYSKIKNWYDGKKWKYKKVEKDEDDEKEDDGKEYYRIFIPTFSGILQGDFGNSYSYGVPVINLIVSRFPISVWFGLISFFIHYLISIPLGISKALKHKSFWDFSTSVFLFFLSSIPSFTLGLILLMTFASSSSTLRIDWIPLGGFRSDDWEILSNWDKLIDQIKHTILPIIPWVAGGFSMTVMMVKNNLLENLSNDYVRTAFAKGLRENKVIYGHAFRNSLIPIIGGLTGLLSIILTSSYLLEKTFNIKGLGLLTFQALLTRDYPISLAYLVISSIIGLASALLADLLWAMINPRIRFN